MQVLIAPDSFKESLRATDAAATIAAGFAAEMPEAGLDLAPIADGGEGSLDAMVTSTLGFKLEKSVSDPLGRPIMAELGVINGDTAVIEIARASGLQIVSRSERDPAVTSTFGSGELISHALDEGLRKFLVMLGGSATNDAGTGILTALGVRFLDSRGGQLRLGGMALGDLASIDSRGFDPRLRESKIVIACDVDNPLLGDRGASMTYAAQKGASPETCRALDGALSNFARIAQATFGKDIASFPGSGAAGGIAAGLSALLDIELRSGFDVVSEHVRLDERMARADIALTAEGSLDHQTPSGKTPAGVARLAKKHDVPLIAFAGRVLPGHESLYSRGLTVAFPISDGPITLEQSMECSKTLLESAARRAARLIKLGISLRS